MMRGTKTRALRLAAWRVMRSLITFTSEDVIGGSGMSGPSARTLLRKLRAAGVIERAQARRVGEAGSRETYRIASGVVGVPRQIDETAAWQQQAWQTMRVKQVFTASALLVTMREGSASLRSVGRYLRALRRAGYIRQCGASTPGQENTYQLVRGEQPAAPVLRMDRTAAPEGREVEHA